MFYTISEYFSLSFNHLYDVHVYVDVYIICILSLFNMSLVLKL